MKNWHCRVIYVWSSDPTDLSISKDTICALKQGGRRRRQVEVSEVQKTDEGPKIEVLEDEPSSSSTPPQIEGPKPTPKIEGAKPRPKIEDVDHQCIFCGNVATRMKRYDNSIKICDKIKCEKKLLY